MAARQGDSPETLDARAISAISAVSKTLTAPSPEEQRHAHLGGQMLVGLSVASIALLFPLVSFLMSTAMDPDSAGMGLAIISPFLLGIVGFQVVIAIIGRRVISSGRPNGAMLAFLDGGAGLLLAYWIGTGLRRLDPSLVALVLISIGFLAASLVLSAPRLRRFGRGS